ncbi:MAG TPA: helix-turn-helix domain-containing protein, partial [Paraburkholderia sp.]
ENLLARAAIYLGDPGNLAADTDASQDRLAVFPEFGRMKRAAGVVKTAAGDANSAARDTSAAAPVTREDVMHALEQSGGNRAAASRALGIGRTTLWRLLKD